MGRKKAQLPVSLISHCKISRKAILWGAKKITCIDYEAQR